MPDREDGSVIDAGFDSATPFRILTVCTMNICRSPALEVTLHDAAANWIGLPAGSVVVGSAGTHATPGAPSCDIAQAHVGRSSRDQTALQLTGEMLAEADLVITAERKHADAVASVGMEFSRRCFPARAAARLATWVVDSGSLEVAIRKTSGEVIERDFAHPESLSDPLPLDPAARLRWLVAQMDGGRGLAPSPPAGNLPYGVEDIPDPHVLGFNLHEMSAEMIIAAVAEFSAAANAVLSAPAT
jgi:protein-tyrosine phosphatase